MNVFLAHIDWSPIIYGIALFLSVMSMAWKLKVGNYVGFSAEILVVAVILLVHGGSVTGGFAATIAGLLSGWFIPVLFRVPRAQRKEQRQELPPDPAPVLTTYEIYQISKRLR